MNSELVYQVKNLLKRSNLTFDEIRSHFNSVSSSDQIKDVLLHLEGLKTVRYLSAVGLYSLTGQV